MQFLVASFTDAWIETCWENGDKTKMRSRIFYRCVDWNSTVEVKDDGFTVASFTDAWIETKEEKEDELEKCRIFYRCVDWNHK